MEPYEIVMVSLIVMGAIFGFIRQASSFNTKLQTLDTWTRVKIEELHSRICAIENVNAIQKIDMEKNFDKIHDKNEAILKELRDFKDKFIKTNTP